MNNETTASQPKSIGDDAQFRAESIDTPEFRALLDSYHCAEQDGLEAAYDAAVKYVDSQPVAPAAQASATIQAAPDKFHWCPECGSEESEPTGCDNGKYCSDCGQEWFPDLDYTDVVRKHLAEWKKRSSAATIQEPVMVAERVGKKLRDIDLLLDSANRYLSKKAVKNPVSKSELAADVALFELTAARKLIEELLK